MTTRAKRLDRNVTIPSGRRRLGGILHTPARPVGAVIFANGSGSSRFSACNREVADILARAGFATLLLDLLEEDESDDRHKVFDVELLANRLQHAADWLSDEPETRDLPLGYFGEGTGAAAALLAAACYPAPVRAVVSRNGRLGLVDEDLPAVRPPTLLIVGNDDESTRSINEEAYQRLRCPRQLIVLPETTRSFEELGACDDADHLARDWFVRYLCADVSWTESTGDPREQAAAKRAENVS